MDVSRETTQVASRQWNVPKLIREDLKELITGIPKSLFRIK